MGRLLKNPSNTTEKMHIITHSKIDIEKKRSNQRAKQNSNLVHETSNRAAGPKIT